MDHLAQGRVVNTLTIPSRFRIISQPVNKPCGWYMPERVNPSMAAHDHQPGLGSRAIINRERDLHPIQNEADLPLLETKTVSEDS